MEDVAVLGATPVHAEAVETADALLTRLFEEEGATLVRLARFFVDDRAAAEDLVQEAFIRLSRSLSRVRQPDNARAYLRAIVLNLARDHNRRGLMSLRHRPPADPEPASVEEQVAERDDARRWSRPWAGCPDASATAWCCATTWSSRWPRWPRRSVCR